ncbi:MAG: signal transduction histidine kinase [Polaribacter sp.]|jgi:signal transduction histidine kinase
MKTLLPLLLIAFSTYTLTAQVGTKPTLENFNKAMEAVNPSRGQIDSILSLSNKYIFENIDTCLILAKVGADFAENRFEGKTVHARSMLILGDAYRINNKLILAEELYIKGRALHFSLGNETLAALADNKLGFLNKDRGDYEKAIEYYVSALAIWEDKKDTARLYKPYLNMAEVFYLFGRLKKAYEYNAIALSFAEITNNERVKAFAISNQGILEMEIANDFIRIADTISLHSQLYKDSAQIFYRKALVSQEYSLGQARSSNNKHSIVLFLGNIADLKIKTGNLEESIQVSKEALKLAHEYGMKEMIIGNETRLSLANYDFGKYDQSIFHAKIALALAEEADLKNGISNANKLLYKAYKKTRQFGKALDHYEKRKKHQEYTQSKETNNAIAEIDVKYQTAQKEKLIIEQKNDILELEFAQVKVEKQRNYFMGGGLALGMFALLGFQLRKTAKDRNDKKDFAEALIFAQEKERKRIARDLHDGIAHSLLLIKKQIGATDKTTVENQALITETLEEVRSISKDLHPLQLEQFGLTKAIKDVVKKVGRSSGLFITTEFENIDDLLSEKMQIHLFRTIQEVLSNIVKHAEATAAKVRIQSVEKEVIISIMDNGKGFDYELAIVRSKSLGLRTMLERISIINGQLKIKENKPTGTVVEIKIPKLKH